MDNIEQNTIPKINPYKTMDMSKLRKPKGLTLDTSESDLERHYFKNLYSFLKLDNITPHMNSVDLLKKSKKLLLNTKEYKGYSTFYNGLTSGYCFKLPRVSAYPIQHNNKFISLKAQIKETAEEIKQRERIPFNQTIKTQNKKYLSTEKSRTTGFNEENSMDSEVFINLIDEYCNKTTVKGKYLKYRAGKMINIPYKNKKFFYDFVNDEDKYQLFEKDENCISSDKPKKFVLQRSFPLTGKNMKVLMEYTPVQILFFSSKGKIIQEIFFPFQFYYYFIGFKDKDFKVFLSYILEYDEVKHSFLINNEKLKKIFEIMKNDKDQFKLFSDKSYLSELKDFEKQSFLEISIPNPIQDSEPKYITYQIKINLPKLKFNLVKSGMQILYYMEKVVDNYQMEYFFNKNFEKWDLFLIYSFSEFKNFRWNINKILSITESRSICIPITTDKYTQNSTLDDYIKKDLLSFDRTTKEVFDVLLRTENKDFIFFEICCPKIKISYHKKRKDASMVIENMIQGDDEVKRDKEIPLNLKQAIQLNKMRKAFTVEDIVRKSVNFVKIVDGNYLTLDFQLSLDDLIFNFDESLLKFLEKRGVESEDVYSKSNLNIAYSPLSFLWHSLNDSGKVTDYIYQMSRDEGREFLDINTEDWSQYIIEHFDKYNSGAENCIDGKRSERKGKHRM